jgi:4-hydroxy-tetrahydrodipicolinate synthase
MVHAGLRADLRDVAAGVLTPFDEDDTDTVREDELAANARWLSDRGLGLFLACANISEYHSLSHEERIASVRVVCDALPADATVLGGVGGSTKTARSLARAHESNGADGIMVMPPDHTFKHETGVARYYHRIADAVDIGVVPYVRGMDVTVRLLDRVVDHPDVVGVKWAVSDLELFSKCVDSASDDIVWVCGMAEPPASAYVLEGAAGFSAGVTNFVPRLGLALFDALEDGAFEHARRLRTLARPLMDLRAGAGEDNVYPGANSVPVVKRGLELAGQYGGPVREPLVDLPEPVRDRVDERYATLQQELDDLGVDRRD